MIQRRVETTAINLMLAGALVWTSAMGGCTCQGTVNESRTSISFQFPQNGQVISASDDVNDDAAGVQVHVIANMRGVTDGTTATLTNSVDLDATGSPTPTNATVEGGQVTFSSYTLPPGEVTLRVAVAGANPDGECQGQRCAEVTVSVVENVCTFNSPRDGEVLSQADATGPQDAPLAPFQTDVVLDCRGLAEGAFVALTVNEGLPRVAQVDGSQRVTFSQVPLAEGANLLQATSDTDVSGRNAQGGTTSATVTVDRGRCTAAFASPTDGARVLASDDVDQDPANGMQANLELVTSCSANATVELWVRGPGDDDFNSLAVTPEDPVLDENNRRFRFNAVELPVSNTSAAPTLLEEFDVTLLARVTEQDDSRTGVTVPTRLWVDASVPEFLVLSPSDNTCIGPLQDQDGDPSNGIQVGSFGQLVTGGEPGTEARVRAVADGVEPASCEADADCSDSQVCRDGGCWHVTTTQTQEFAFDAFEVPAGNVTLEYTAADPAGNVSAAKSVPVQVFDTAPTASITDPSSGDRLGISADQNPDAPGLQTQVTLQMTNVPAGTTASLLVSGQSPVPFSPPTGDGGSVDVPVTLQDGERALRVSVQDPCGNEVISDPVEVVVASDPPDVVATLYEGTANGFAERRDIPDGGHTNVGTVDLDIYTGPGNAERTVNVAIHNTVDTTDGQRQCTTGSGSPSETSTTVAADADGHRFTGLSLSEGVNCFSISVDDGVNALSQTLLVRYRAPGSATIEPSFTNPNPTEGPVTITSSEDSDPNVDGINYSFDAQLSQPDDVAGTLVLQLVDADTVFDSVHEEVAAGTGSDPVPVSFTDVSLPHGSYALQLVYEDAFGNQVEAAQQLSVTVGSGNLSVRLTAPPNATALARPDDPDDGSDGGEIPVDVTSTGNTEPTSCNIFLDDAVDAGPTAVLTDVPWDSGQATTTFDVPVDDFGQGVQFLRAECTDTDSGETAFTQTVRVSLPDTLPSFVDESAGIPGRLVFDGNGFVNSFTGDTSAAQGLQHDIQALVNTGGVSPAGLTVSLSMTRSGDPSAACGDAPSGDTTTYDKTLRGGGDPVLVGFESVDFGTAQGPVWLELGVTDKAGNTSMTTSTCLVVDTEAPTLVQTNPDPAQSTLTRDDDVDTDPLSINTLFTYDVSGAEPQSEVRFALTPEPTVGGPFPLTQLLDGSSVTFPEQDPDSPSVSSIGFQDGTYTAQATITDAAGNVGTSGFEFEVRGQQAKLTWRPEGRTGGALNAAADTDKGTEGFQGSFSFAAIEMRPGTIVRLCSNNAPASATEPCEWGANGQPNGPNSGFVVGQAPLTGSDERSGAVLTAVNLLQGPQVLHAEAKEADGTPNVFTPFLNFTVDSIPPVIDGIELVDNDTNNDGPDTVRLAAAEGTNNENRLTTTVRVSVTGAPEGQRVRLLSDYPTQGTVVGQGSLTGGQAEFEVKLAEASHVLTARVEDDAGNMNATTGSEAFAVGVEVDFTAPSVNLSTPEFAPYTSANGEVTSGGDALAVATSASVSDNQSLGGVTLTLARYDDADCTTVVAGTETELQLTDGQSIADFQNFPLAWGENHLGVQVADTSGNSTGPSASDCPECCRTYEADFTGPELELVPCDQAAEPTARQDCGGETSPCPVEIVEQEGRARFCDFSEDNCTTPPAPLDLCYRLPSCEAGQTSEACTAEVDLQLQSRVVGGGGSFTTVFNTATSVSELQADLISYEQTVGTDYLFDPGNIREMRLVGVDEHGNISQSGSVFIELGFAGVTIEVERLDASRQGTGDNLTDGTHWGIAENINGENTPYTTNLRVHMEPFGVTSITNVQLEVSSGSDSATFTPTTLSASAADFDAVELYPTTTDGNEMLNLVTVRVEHDDCSFMDGNCSVRTYSEVVADLAEPSYQFDRCSLCDLHVPMDPPAGCGDNYDQPCGWCYCRPDDEGQIPEECSNPRDNCADGHLSIAAGEGGGANTNDSADIALPSGTPLAPVGIWNADLDPDGDPANGFTTTSASPLVVRLNGVEEGELVTLESSRNGLSGNTVLTKSCTAGSGTCAEFTGFSAASLGGTAEHQISVNVSDKAGNPAEPDPLRSQEVVYARTDTAAPAGVAPTVCIGESTTPADIASPDSDPRTYEQPICEQVCSQTNSCSRLGASASLAWTAPAEDGSSGGQVDSYEIVVAARGIPYEEQTSGEQATYTDCSEIIGLEGSRPSDLSGVPVEVRQVGITPSVAPGELETAVVDGLHPNRSYCFLVQAVDDAGNRSDVQGLQAERVLPLLSHPEPTEFDLQYRDGPGRWTTVDDKPDAALFSMANGEYFDSNDTSTVFGFGGERLGDLDGDDREDFLLARVGEPPTRAYLFLSATSTEEPAVVIRPPGVPPEGTGEALLFGRYSAGGDFDNDGLNDLFICAPYVSIGGASNAGAVYIYYGVAGDGIGRDASTDDRLPSIKPDVALFGSDNAQLCTTGLAVAEVSGAAGDDLLVTTNLFDGQYQKLLGFESSGNRDRFPVSPPDTTIVEVDASQSGPGNINQPDFILQGRSDSVGFPYPVEATDLNGDGVSDIAVADPFYDRHGCSGCRTGEVYIFRGGSGLVGTVDYADNDPAQLAHIIHPDASASGNSAFGTFMENVPSPRSADAGDWLLIQDKNRVYAVEGSETQEQQPSDELSVGRGEIPASASYQLLDNTHWDGSRLTRFGGSIATIGDLEGDGNVDIAVGPGHTSSDGVMLLKFDPATDGFIKRSFLFGEAGSKFGSRVFGVEGFGQTDRTEIVVTQPEVAGTEQREPAVFLYY